MDLQGAHTDPLLQAGATPSEEGAAAGCQLFETKGLAQHVVRSRIQERHHGLRSSTGRKHHYGAMKLGRQPEGGGFLQQLRADEEVGSLALTDFESFASGANGGSQMTILPKPLGENSPKGDVGINHKNPSGMAAVISIIRLSHKSLI
jgi:hypothetical protein